MTTDKTDTTAPPRALPPKRPPLRPKADQPVRPAPAKPPLFRDYAAI